MFNSKMKESTEREVPLSGGQFEVLQYFIRFLYEDEIQCKKLKFCYINKLFFLSRKIGNRNSS